MNLRPTLTDKPARALAAAGGLLLIGVAVILLQMRGGGAGSAAAARGRLFFTVDDGKTWFADDANKLPPYDKDGKPAVRAYVYRTAKGTEFANHLERFTPDARRTIENAGKSDGGAKGPPKNLAAIQSAYTAGRELKRPGDAKWVAAASFRDAAQVTAVKPPDGSADATPVDP